MTAQRADSVKTEDLVLFSNGPGEVSTWVLPVVEAVRGRSDLSSRYRIVLVIHPCQFGSGTEHLVARRIDGIDTVIGPGEYVKMLLTGLGMKKYSFSREGIIFSLGGNLMHPVLFRRRIKGRHRLFAYSNNPGWHDRYERVFVRSDYVKQKFESAGCPAGKLLVTGDLVASSLKRLRSRAEARKALGVTPTQKMIVFMPGSREFEVKYMLPVFLKVIADLTAARQGLKPFILRSPYVHDSLVELALSMGGRIREAESLLGRLVERGGLRSVALPGGAEVPLLEGGLETWGEGIDLAATVPGTNTVQLAYRGIPALVVAALNKPELIPIEGAAGLVKLVPFVGKRIVRRAVLSYARRFPYAALPNIYENEELLPELFGVITTAGITDKLASILAKGGEREIRKKLSRFRFETDPIDLIVEGVWPV
jgi:hypothetical protein